MLMDSDQNVFKYDPDAISRVVDGKTIVYTADDFAKVKDDGTVWSPYGP